MRHGYLAEEEGAKSSKHTKSLGIEGSGEAEQAAGGGDLGRGKSARPQCLVPMSSSGGGGRDLRTVGPLKASAQRSDSRGESGLEDVLQLSPCR